MLVEREHRRRGVSNGLAVANGQREERSTDDHETQYDTYKVHQQFPDNFVSPVLQ